MKQLLLTASAIACAVLGATPAHADIGTAPLGKAPVAVSVPATAPSASEPVVQRFAQARQISPAEAKRIALSRVRGGEVVDIRRSGNSYRVRVIARDGRVVDIVVDARTGRVR